MRLEEVTELMEKMTPKTKDTFVYARLKEKQQIETKSRNSTLSFGIALRGKPVEVTLSSGARKRLLYDSKAPVSEQTFEKIASATDLSNRKAKLVATEFRRSEGKHSIETGFAEETYSLPKEIIKKYFKKFLHRITGYEEK